jgi:hypothetical protein
MPVTFWENLGGIARVGWANAYNFRPPIAPAALPAEPKPAGLAGKLLFSTTNFIVPMFPPGCTGGIPAAAPQLRQREYILLGMPLGDGNVLGNKEEPSRN